MDEEKGAKKRNQKLEQCLLDNEYVISIKEKEEEYRKKRKHKPPKYKEKRT